MILRMDLEYISGPQGIYIRVNIKEIKGMDMERCHGLTAVIIEVNGLMEFKMVMER